MTKRPNPYSDDNQPQIKIHVGMKEYNNTHEKMKTVFDKTLAILYRGANQKGDDSDNIKTDTPFKNDNARKFKQMFLGKNCTLQSTGTLHVRSGKIHAWQYFIASTNLSHHGYFLSGKSEYCLLVDARPHVCVLDYTARI